MQIEAKKTHQKLKQDYGDEVLLVDGFRGPYIKKKWYD